MLVACSGTIWECLYIQAWGKKEKKEQEVWKHMKGAKGGFENTLVLHYLM